MGLRIGEKTVSNNKFKNLFGGNIFTIETNSTAIYMKIKDEDVDGGKTNCLDLTNGVTGYCGPDTMVKPISTGTTLEVC